MPELRNILNENATPSAASAVTSSSLLTVGSRCVRARNVIDKGCRSGTCLRVLVAALASAAAIAILISFCSRVLERRAVQSLGSRRLGNSEDSDGSIDVCGSTGDEDEEGQPIQFPIDSESQHVKLPIKKRVLPREGETGTDDDARSPLQGDQQDQVVVHDIAGPPFGYFPPGDGPTPEQHDLTPFPSHGQPVQQRPSEGNVTELLRSPRYQHSAHHYDPGTMNTPFLEIKRLQRELQQLQEQLERERRHHREQQRMYREHLHWQQMLWQQQDKDQYQVQQQDQQQHHLPQQQHHAQYLLPHQQHPHYWANEAQQQFMFDQREQQQQHLPQQEKNRPQQQQHAQYLLHQQQYSHYWHQQQRQQHLFHQQDQQEHFAPQEPHAQYLLQHQQNPQYWPHAQQQNYLLQQQEQGKQDLQKQRQHTQNLMQQQQRPQYWPQQQQQQYFSQQQGNPQPPQSQQHYGVQQREQYTHLLHQQEPNYFPEQKEQHSAQEESKQPHLQLQKHGEQVKQQERQVTATEQVGQEQEQIRQRQGHQEKPKLQEEGETRQLQPADEVSAQLEEDEWIFQVSPAGEAEPSGSQEALQPYARGTAAGPSTSENVTREEVPGLAQALAAFSGSASGVSRDKGAAVPGMGAAAAAPAGMPAGGRPSADPFSAASATAGGGNKLSAPLLASLLTSRIGAGEALAEAAPAADSPLMAPVATPAQQELPGPVELSPADLVNHPFVRLPVPKLSKVHQVIVVDFERALTTAIGTRSAIPSLQKARQLLALEVVDVSDMMEMAVVAAELIEHAYHYECQDLSRHHTFRAVKRLGVRFLILDAVVSILTVLRQTPDPKLWERFTDAISDAAPPPTERANFAARTLFFTHLTQKLSSAIQLLKRAQRPEPAELLKIKRMLFCSEYSPSGLKQREFDSWRADDSNRFFALELLSPQEIEMYTH